MLESNIKISVIIPVYNVEKYLHECIDSILNQDYTNLEVILINDGSPDSSGLICNNYAVKDQRIKVLHQQNQGVAAARNLGLKYATGDYISFIDSDDWIDQGMYLNIIDSIKKQKNTIDIAYMPYPYEKGQISKTVYNKREIREQFLDQFIGTRKIGFARMPCVWSLCIHKEIIKGISFYNLTMVEDKVFFIESILQAQSLLIIAEKYYNYRVNLNSLSHNYYKNYIKNMTIGHRIIKEMLKKQTNNNQGLDYLNNNSIVSFYYHSIKNELRNKNLEDFNIIKQSVKQYYQENNIRDLLTWERTARLSFRNPKWLLIKIGYADLLLKVLWKRAIKKNQKKALFNKNKID